MSEDWDSFKSDSNAAKKLRRERGEGLIWELMDEGYEFEELNPYQFRINDQIDLYPTNSKYHVLKTNKRGYYTEKNLSQIIKDNVK